jgi:phosphoribosylanthranilate isomerase
MTRVKICGITKLQDALHATACGAEMLGFNFYPNSPRYIRPESAREIIASLPATVETVGVFVNEASPAVVRQLANISGIQSVQLHGNEDSQFCAALEDLNVIKVFRADDKLDVKRISNFLTYRILLDSPSTSFGGSGAKFDWQIARRVREQVPYLILAGGLNSESVTNAINTVSPDAVDACSLLESSPGIKDHQEVNRFIAVAHAINIRSAKVD